MTHMDYRMCAAISQTILEVIGYTADCSPTDALLVNSRERQRLYR